MMATLERMLSLAIEDSSLDDDSYRRALQVPGARLPAAARTARGLDVGASAACGVKAAAAALTGARAGRGRVCS